jgi:cobyrinic acid a,c-diamide synthase
MLGDILLSLWLMKSDMLIGAAASGGGKTVFSLGLLRALRDRALCVQPFKCGPDYIDGLYHRKVTGVASINLDSFMMSEDYLCSLYRRHTLGADVTVCEGVMGLFDGYEGMCGSSAEMACRLGIPVVLLVNARSTAYSVAPLIYGFRHFHPQLRLAGVVFNWVASASHYASLRKAAEDVGVASLGYLPRRAALERPSRYLGLSLDELQELDAFATTAAGLVEEHVDLDRLLALTATEPPSPLLQAPAKDVRVAGIRRIAVARDEAFNFIYEENLRYLSRIAELVFFSPLNDAELPAADFIYLPGGYPELYLPRLSANRSLMEGLAAYIEVGGKVLAECGGMMYLCASVADAQNRVYPMAGILRQDVTMQRMTLCLGYRRLLYEGREMRGHEFHYSRIRPQASPLPSVAQAFNAGGTASDTALYRYKNLLAGYTHLYWADDTRNDWFINFLNSPQA